MIPSLVTLGKEKGSGKSRMDPSFSNLGRRDESQVTKQGKNNIKKFIYPELDCFCKFPQALFLKKKNKLKNLLF